MYTARRDCLIVFSLGLLLLSRPVAAEVTLKEGKRSGEQGLSRIHVAAGASIRAVVIDVMGSSDRGSYQRNLYDGSSRYMLRLNYNLDEDLSLVNLYENSMDIPKIVGWKGHYASGARNTVRRQMYSGLRSERWGELTWGQRNSVYYETISAKTDIWGNDLHAEPATLGAGFSIDGSWGTRNTLMYVRPFGPATLYASYMSSAHERLLRHGLRFKRHNGAGLAVDYRVTPDLTLAVAGVMTRDSLRNDDHSDARRVNQQLLGSAVSWKPGLWTVAVSGGWYHHFVALARQPADRYFAHNAWGASYFVGRDFPVQMPVLKSVMPIWFGDRLRAGHGPQRRFIRENGLGVVFYLKKGFRIDYQHVFRSGNDRMGDINFMRLRYDF